MMSLSLSIFAFAMTFTPGEAHESSKLSNQTLHMPVPELCVFNSKLQINILGCVTSVSHSSKL